jgi:hypothetical protein
VTVYGVDAQRPASNTVKSGQKLATRVRKNVIQQDWQLLLDFVGLGMHVTVGQVKILFP